MSEERRAQNRRFTIDEAKFSTQRLVTYILLLIFTAVTANVLLGQDQAERSTIIQTVINFAMLAIGFWLGASKQAQDTAQSVSRIAEAAPGVAAAVVAAAVAPLPAAAPAPQIKTEDVNVLASGDVTVNEKKP